MSKRKICLQLEFEVDEDYLAADCDNNVGEFNDTIKATVDDYVDWLNSDYAGDVGDDEPKAYVELTSCNVVE